MGNEIIPFHGTGCKIRDCWWNSKWRMLNARFRSLADVGLLICRIAYITWCVRLQVEERVVRSTFKTHSDRDTKGYSHDKG